MKKVYFVRHGQSIDNSSSVYQSTDSPLSEKGLAQAFSIANRMSKLTFDSLSSSPLLRVKETAVKISQLTGKSLEFSDLFIERIKPTSVNGKPHSDEKATAVWIEWEKSLYNSGQRVEDGENYDDIVPRADRALEYLKYREEETLVVVTHGFFLRVLVDRVLLGNFLNGELLKRFRSMTSMENTGVTLLSYQKGQDTNISWRLKIYNDHVHLAE